MSEEKHIHSANPPEPPDAGQLDHRLLEALTAPCPASEGDGTSQQQKIPHLNTALMETELENGINNNSLSQPDLTRTLAKSITYQPQARSAPVHSALATSAGSKALLGSVSTPQSNSTKNGTFLPSAHKTPKKLHSNPSIYSQRSKGSSQMPTEARDDCCVHSVLACLFCEFLTLCNIVLNCATCGSCASNDSCFCCCCASEECADCDLPCDMDCGIIDACCESADCLEICMECCGLCFTS